MLETSEPSEGSSDWEVIQHPFNSEPYSPPPPDGRLHDFELVIRDNYYDDNSSIFPPSEHEDLPLLGEDSASPRIMSISRSPLSSACSDIDVPEEGHIKPDSRLSLMMNEIGSRMSTCGRRVFQVILCSNSRCSSFIPAAAMVIALFACMKIMHWRNRILLLIREKDQRISQLLHQIAQMNDILSARRKVPVMRIN